MYAIYGHSVLTMMTKTFRTDYHLLSLTDTCGGMNSLQLLPLPLRMPSLTWWAGKPRIILFTSNMHVWSCQLTAVAAIGAQHAVRWRHRRRSGREAQLEDLQGPTHRGAQHHNHFGGLPRIEQWRTHHAQQCLGRL